MSNLIDFLKKLRRSSKYSYRSGWDLGPSSNVDVISDVLYTDSTPSTMRSEPDYPAKTKEMDNRIEMKPVEVFQEIVSEEPKMNLASIDKQIKMVKKRKELLESMKISLSDEIEALKFLEARKKLLKKKYNFRWSITTFSKIETLLKKYKLQIVNVQSFYKTIPMEGINEMEKFLEEYKKVRDDLPVIKLIIDEGGRETKKDPIILASSPFGKWFYILGAWDKEVEIIDDLIYKGK
jgi:hypothetical protein